MIIDYDLLRIFSKIQDHLLAAGAVETTVAGGAIRDMLLDKPIKDIDVFYVGNLEVDKLSMFEEDYLLEASYEDVQFCVTHIGVKYKDCPYPIQLIQVDVEVGKLDGWIRDSFDCNLSKVSFGKHLQLTQEFLDDTEMEMLTFPNSINQKYMYKMINKFPDYIVNGTYDDVCLDF